MNALLRSLDKEFQQIRRKGIQASAALLEYGAYPIMMFVATPLLLHFLGAKQYGQYLLVLALNGFGNVAGLGMGPAIVRDVAGHRSSGDLSAAARAARNGLALTLVSAALIFVVILAVALGIGPSLLVKMGSTGEIRLIFIYAAALIVIEQVDIAFASTMRGFERFDLSAKLEVTTKCAIVALAVVAAWQEPSFSAVILVTILATLGRCAIKAYFASRLLGQGALLPRWDTEVIKRLFSFGIWTWGQSIGSTLFGVADRLLVSALLGPDLFARYSVSLQLTQQIQALPAAVAQLLLPYTSRKERDGEGKIQLRRGVKIAMATITAAAAALSLTLVVLGQDILTLWVGSDLADGAETTLVILSIGFGILALSSVPHFVLLGLGDSRFVAYATLGASLISVSCAPILIKTYSIEGAALSKLIFSVIIGVLLAKMIRVLK